MRAEVSLEFKLCLEKRPSSVYEREKTPAAKANEVGLRRKGWMSSSILSFGEKKSKITTRSVGCGEEEIPLAKPKRQG